MFFGNLALIAEDHSGMHLFIPLSPHSDCHHQCFKHQWEEIGFPLSLKKTLLFEVSNICSLKLSCGILIEKLQVRNVFINQLIHSLP